MLDQKVKSETHGAWEMAINLLGLPATWIQAKPPNASKGITVGFKTAGWKDTEVVNSYGYGAKIITMKAVDFTTTIPEKYDTIEVNGERYTLDEVMPVMLNDKLLGHKGYVRGDR